MGTVARYRCEACGFESEDLGLGFGMMSESFPVCGDRHLSEIPPEMDISWD